MQRISVAYRALLLLLLLVAAAAPGCIDASGPALPTTPTASTDKPATTSVASTLPDDHTLRAMLDEAIDLTQRRAMNTRDHAAWQIVHGILAYGPALNIEHQGQLVPALDYLLAGGSLNGWKFAPGDHGLNSILESGTKTGQGHLDQWLGYLSQRDIPEDQTLVWEGKTYTVHDLVTQAQWNIREGQEATWTLMGLGTYLPLDARWTASDGSEWTLERIIDMEASQNLKESACGGSHRLYGISSALNRYKNELDPQGLTGGWLKAEQVVQASIKTIKDYQQPEGSFSVNYLERASTSPDVALRLNTTGHQLEFLTISLNDQQLQEPWMVKAAVHLCGLFMETKDLAVECGGLYHAAHGLQLYRFRRFGERENQPAPASEAPPPAAPLPAALESSAGVTTP